MRILSFKSGVITCFCFSLFACRSPLGDLTAESLKKQRKTADEHPIGSFAKTRLSRKNFSFHNMDGKVYKFEDIESMPLSLREEIFRRELLRREAIRRGGEESFFSNAEAQEYVWPRLEKILEEYYYYKKLDYPAILRKNKLRFSGRKAIEQFYEKNRANFAKEKLTIDDVKLQIEKKIQLLTDKEFEEKKLLAIQELLKQEKMDILR